MRVLPQPKKPKGAPLRTGLIELSHRVAAQHAAGLVRKIPHNAMNTSNMEIDGKLLDYGTQSAVPGHGIVSTLPRSTRQGSGATPLSMLDKVWALAYALAVGASKAEGKHIPQPNELTHAFKLMHGESLVHRLVELLGFPPALLTPLMNSERFYDVGLALHAVTFLPTKIQRIYDRAPKWTGVYSVGRLSYALACLWRTGPKATKRALLGSAKNPLIETLVDAYVAFRRDIDDEAAETGVPRPVVDDLIVRLSVLRNENRERLYRFTMTKTYERLVRGGNLARLAMQVDADVEEARRFFESTNPDEILLRAWADRPTAGRSTVEYRFAEGAYVLDVRAHVESGEAFFFSKKMKASLPLQVVLRASSPGRPAEWLRGPLLSGDSSLSARLALAPSTSEVEISVLPADSRAQPKTGGLKLTLLPPTYFKGVDRIVKKTELPRRVVAQPLDATRLKAR